MLPNGCFGSSLAYEPKSAVCSACPSRVECAAKVEARYPNWIRLLARFSDSAGKTMDEAWLTPADKKARKEQRKLLALREAELQTFGDPAVGQNLRDTMDKRAHTHLDDCVDLRINPLTADMTELCKVSTAMKSAVTALLAAPTHRDTIAQSIASDCGLSARTAKRDTDALLAFLKRCGRIALDKKTKIAEIQ
jgi:hypothetical protein